MWDSYTAVERWGVEPAKYDIRGEVMYAEIGPGICEWYCRVADELYGLYIVPDTIRKAQRQFGYAKQALAGIGPIRRFYLEVIGRVAKFDTTSLLYPLKRDESLFSAEEYQRMKALVDEGVGQAQAMLPVALGAMNGDTTPLPAWFGDTDFAGKPAE